MLPSVAPPGLREDRTPHSALVLDSNSSAKHLSRRAVDAGEEREDRGHRAVHFRWDFLIEFQPTEYLHEVRVLAHRHVVLLG